MHATSLLAASLIGLSALSAQAATVRLDAPGAIQVGQTFSIAVQIDQPFDGAYTGDELLAFGFDLSFDTALLRLVGSTVAVGWDDDSSAFPDVDVAGSAFPGIVDLGQASLQLATLSFEVLAGGNAWVSISTDVANNWNHGLIYFNNDALALNATTHVAGVVPEADTYAMLLAGLGLIGFAVRRRG